MDVVSGSWPGEVYWFRRMPDGAYATGETLKHSDGKPINVGSASAAYATDWDHDGDLDLIIGVIDGGLHLVPNLGKRAAMAFGTAQLLSLDRGSATLYDAAPVVADWDADGRQDLLVGTDSGAVYLFRNRGAMTQPEFAAAVELIPASPVGSRGNLGGEVRYWGSRVKPCVADWNGDGLLDLLVGDVCGSFQGKPAQDPDELAAERDALRNLPSLMNKWATVLAEYRALQKADRSQNESPQAKRLVTLRTEIVELNAQISRSQEIVHRYEPRQQNHGFVWLFLRQKDQPNVPSRAP